jgi:WD40 repeat protein
MKLAELTEACSNPWTVIWRQKMAGHFAPIECIAISSNGSWLASCSSDSSAAVWDLKKTARSQVGPAGEPPPANPIMPNQKLIGHLDAVHCVSFSPASDTLCTASEDRTARVWRLTYEAEMVVIPDPCPRLRMRVSLPCCCCCC